MSTDRAASNLINLAVYPIDRLGEAAGRALLARCRAQLAEAGALTLPNFLTDEATTALATEARGLSSLAHHYEVDHTIYFEPSEDDRPEEHPRRQTVRTAKGNVAYDLIPATAEVRSLYEWDTLLAFVAAVLEEPVLFRHGDAMAALNINVHGPGEELGWHFDRTDFAITLSLCQSDAGGVFEYVANLRSDDDENFPSVAATANGDRTHVRIMDSAPGTFALFRGHYSLHRVTPSEGPNNRLMAAFSYVRQPDVTFSPYARKLFYGRTVAQGEAA